MATFGRLMSRTTMLFIAESGHFLLMLLSGLTFTIIYLVVNKNAFIII